jgi:hypothetical protein
MAKAKGTTFLTRGGQKSNPKGIKELKPCPYECPECGDGYLGREDYFSCYYDCGHKVSRAEL